MQFDTFRAMNTEIVVAAEGEPAEVASGFRRTRDFILAEEARFSRFSEDSELVRLNQAGGAWFHASMEMFDVLRQARSYAEATSGLFDPAILESLERAGYDKSMDEIRTYGANPRAGGAPVKRRTLRAVLFDPSRRAILLPPGMRLDLGGIAKGWIGEQAALRLKASVRACVVDAGGDMFAVGVPEEGAWKVALENPLDPDRALAILSLGPGAIATSSVTRRRWQQGDQAQHHIIDPRTGEAAVTDWLSVTVIASHATTAEVYAKALLIAGKAEAGRLAAGNHEVAAFLAVDRLGKLWGSWEAGRYLDGRVEGRGAVAPTGNLLDARV